MLFSWVIYNVVTIGVLKIYMNNLQSKILINKTLRMLFFSEVDYNLWLKKILSFEERSQPPADDLQLLDTQLN